MFLVSLRFETRETGPSTGSGRTENTPPAVLGELVEPLGAMCGADQRVDRPHIEQLPAFVVDGFGDAGHVGGGGDTGVESDVGDNLADLILGDTVV